MTFELVNIARLRWKREEVTAMLAEACGGFTDSLYDKSNEAKADYFKLKKEYEDDNAE